MNKVMIVAELSANHAGSLQVAIDTIKAAKRAGADAIKIQTYTADTLTLNCNLPDFVCGSGLCGMEEHIMTSTRKHIHLGNGTLSCFV